MKKVFLSLAALALVATGSLAVTSCGSDDSAVAPPVSKGIKLALTTNPADIYAGKPFELTIQKADGTPITGAVLYVNGEATDIESQDGVYSIQGPAGEITLTAVYEGETSNEVDVVVKEAQVVPSEGTGTFKYEGTTYTIENSAVVFTGLFYKDATKTDVVAVWDIQSESGNHTAFARFSTPATPAGNNQYNYQEPNATNTTGIATAVFVGETLGGQADKNVVIDFDAPRTDNFFVGTYSATSDPINDSPFSLEFEGKTPLVDGSAKASAKGIVNYVTAGKTINAGKLTVLDTKISK